MRKNLILLFIGLSLLFLFCLPAIVSALLAEEIEVSASEDLMREHGALSRVLLIYEEITRRMDSNQNIPVDGLEKSSKIIRSFIQQYHEKLEERYIFPKFKGTDLEELVKVLQRQHDSGRKIMNDILGQEKFSSSEDKEKLASNMDAFIRMYRPHKAREDTVLFPALHSLVKPEEYLKMGRLFEDEEKKLFGEKGFEKTVSQIEEIEKSLGIQELSQYTFQ